MKQGYVMALGLFLLWCGLAGAGTFNGLEPGVSKKADADRVLGKPIREVIKGVRYDYDAKAIKARRLSITYQPKTAVIETINIYPKETVSKDKFRKWLALKEPQKKEIDRDGNFIEYYLSSGVALHFDGPDDSGPVKYFSHIDASLIGGKSLPGAGGAAGGQPIGQGQVAFLGIYIGRDDQPGVKVLGIIPDSPAQRHGLMEDDIILEMAQYKYYRKGTTPAEVLANLSSLPAGTPQRFLVQREGYQIEARIDLEARSKEALAADKQKYKKIAQDHFDKGQALLTKGQYSSAILYLEQAVQYKPANAYYRDNLGYGYYKTGQKDLALKQFNKSVTLKPDAYYPHFHLGLIYYQRKDYENAIKVLNQAVRLRPGDDKKTVSFEYLGASYYFADQAFLGAHKINPKSPMTVYYLGACFDRRENKRDAVYYYKKYLRMDHDNAGWNRRARERLKALTYDPQKAERTKKTLLDIMDAVKKEMHDFNK
jgi:tetratricopeptide (TPR) repeat protein